MSNFDQIIEKLLLQTHCVVIPGLGGFVANYQKSSYNLINHTFNPPFKALVFNAELVLNDGLLLQEFQKNGLDIIQAQQFIENWVNSAKIQLNSGNRVEIKGVGFLFKDETGKIRFVQDFRNNLLKSSFGLYPIKIRALQEDISSKPQETNLFKDRKFNAEGRPIKSKSANALRKLVRYSPFLLFPLLGIFTWMYFNNNPSQKGKQLAGFSFNSENYQPINYNLELFETENTPEIPDTSGNYLLKLTDLPNIKPLVVKVEEQADSLKVQTPFVEQISEINFVIIGGCFSNPVNAENFTKQLQSEGYPAQRINQKFNGLTRVVFGRYATRAEAQMRLQKIKQKYPNAWISTLN